MTKLGAPTIRHVTKLGRLFHPQLPRPGRCRPRLAPRLPRRSRLARRSGSAGPCSLPRREPGGRRCRPCSSPRARTPCSRTLSHGDIRTADQRDGLSRIAAAAAPHRPRTGGAVASRARIRDCGGTAARPRTSPADGRSAPRAPHPSPLALGYAHNRESRSRRTAGHVNPGGMPPCRRQQKAPAGCPAGAHSDAERWGVTLRWGPGRRGRRRLPSTREGVRRRGRSRW